MNNRAPTPTLIVVVLLVAAAFAAFPPWAQAQSLCDIFPLTTGGIPEADLNGDGLTCEFNTIDSVTGVWTTIAVDNVAVIGPSDCPDGFTGSISMGLCCKFVHLACKADSSKECPHVVCIGGIGGPQKKK